MKYGFGCLKIKQIHKGVVMNNKNRYCSIEQSIVSSCKQVKAMRRGEVQKRFWKDCKKEIHKIKKNTEI